jgi:hypothetical protein
MLLGTRRNLRPVQSLDFVRRETDQEVLWKASGVTLNLLIGPFGSDAIKSGWFGVE